MNKIIKVLMVSTFANIILVLVKLIFGILGNCRSLLADAIKTLTDLTTDIVAIIGEEIFIKEKQKSNKNIEYITSIIMGILILVAGLSLLSNINNTDLVKPNIFVVYAIIVSIIIKTIITNYIIEKGKKYNNHILIASGRESSTEVISSVLVLISFVLTQLASFSKLFLYSDIVGSIIIGLIIIKTGFDILKENIISIFGKKHEDEEFIKEIKNIIKEHPHIKEINNIGIIKYGTHYKTFIEVVLLTEVGIIEASNLINIINKKLKTRFKHKMKHIKIKVKD